MTTLGNDFRYISETHHSCYEIEIKVCSKCGFASNEDIALLYTEKHELRAVEGYIVDQNGEFIYYGICADCNERGYTAP